MKKLRIISSILFISLGVTFLSGCNTNDNPPIDKIDDKVDLNEVIKEVVITIPNSSNIFLKDVTDLDLVVSGIDPLKFNIEYLLTKDFSKNELKVEYRIKEVDKVVYSLYKEVTFKDFKVDGSIPLIPLVPATVVDLRTIDAATYLEGKENTNIPLRLNRVPNNEIKLVITSSNDKAITLLDKEITFNDSNYDIEQYIHFNTIYDSSLEDKESIVSISFNDRVIKTIKIKVINIDVPYKGDINISSSNLILNVNEEKIIKVSLTEAPINDFIVNINYDSTYLALDKSTLTFSRFTYANDQEIKVRALDFKDPLLENYKTSITLSNKEIKDKVIDVSINKVVVKEKEEVINPYASGLITAPLKYFTAYYDVDFKIKKLFVEYNNNGKWVELDKSTDSFTSSSCLIKIPDELSGTTPIIHLKAQYDEKVDYINKDATFTLEGYKIKGTIDGYTEYFNPLASVPKALINSSNEYEIKDYLTFTRDTSFGTKENFYLPLRPLSTSRLTINGLHPTSLDKVYKVTQDRRNPYYHRLFSYYSMNNSHLDMTFIDKTIVEDITNYPLWKKIVSESIDTFNSCLNIAGINASIKEVNEGSTNSLVFHNIESDVAGLCEYHTNENNFLVRVNNNPNIINGSLNSIKSTLVHEFGHLLGFNDSAYASNDSIYSYARERNLVTYFQPNDISTLLAFN